MTIKFDKTGEGVFTLDCRGFASHLSQQFTGKMLEKIGSGDVLEVIFDNPSSSESITEMCSSSGSLIIEKNVEDGQYIYRIKKG